jgi:hypothetical protein
LIGLRAKRRTLFNIEERTGPWDYYEETLACYKKEIRKTKPSSCSRYCQQWVEHLIPHLCRIFRSCMACGFIPTAWRQVKDTFIPKPGRLDYTEAKASHPIRLSYFLLKRMEKLIDRHMPTK